MHYLIFTIDFIVIFTFFYIALKNIWTMRIVGLFKAFMFVVVFWFVSRVAGLEMSTQVFGVMISYAFLAVIVMFPEEFKKMLDNFGRKDIVQWNKYKLISKESINELAGAIMQLSRRREGVLIVIARKSDLEDEINKGEKVGNLSINENVIKELLKENSHFAQGAMIIRDDEIVSLNVLLDMYNYQDLVRKGAGKRHLAAFWVAKERDCIAIAVSAKTGKITIASTEKKRLEYSYAMATKETDITDGLDEQSLAALIERRLLGKNEHLANKEENKKRKLKIKRKEKKRNENNGWVKEKIISRINEEKIVRKKQKLSKKEKKKKKKPKNKKKKKAKTKEEIQKEREEKRKNREERKKNKKKE